MLLASISVDLDEVPCYAAIHGLKPPSSSAATAIYRKALPRYERLLSELQIAATFFIVGRDLADEGNRAMVAGLHRQGHEIANHSANHLYDLIRRDRELLREEIKQGAEAIERAIGVCPVGFRAPGYSVSDTLFELLEALEVRYDSSVFPCPLYYGAKALSMAAILAAGRKSRAILCNPMVLTSPVEPYRVAKPYWKRGDGLVELPMTVTRGLSGRLPYIGTSLVLSGVSGAKRLTKLVVGKPFVNLELHGIDLADADQDGLGFLRGHQPDLRRGLDEKQQALRAAIEVLREAGYRFATLAEVAATVS